MKEVVFVSPYLKNRHAGGGEKHLFEVALALPSTYRPSIALPLDDNLTGDDLQRELNNYRQFYEQFLGTSLKRCHFITSPLFTNQPWWQKLWWTRHFDYLYYVSDGSLFFSLARHNLLHIQTPPHHQPSQLDLLKLKNWHQVSCNSLFTKNQFEKVFSRQKQVGVLYPMAKLNQSRPVKKEKIIVSIGRFFPQLHAKRQDVLIEIFRQLRAFDPSLLRDWRLVLIGPVENEAYFRRIQGLAKNLPVTLITDAKRQELESWLYRASLYWSATGYGQDESESPQLVEHFGMALIEAMLAGAVPIVTKRGGHREILTGQLDQLLWQTKHECLTLSHRLIAQPQLRRRLRSAVTKRAKQFGEPQFKLAVKNLFSL